MHVGPPWVRAPTSFLAAPGEPVADQRRVQGRFHQSGRRGSLSACAADAAPMASADARGIAVGQGPAPLSRPRANGWPTNAGVQDRAHQSGRRGSLSACAATSFPHPWTTAPAHSFPTARGWWVKGGVVHRRIHLFPLSLPRLIQRCPVNLSSTLWRLRYPSSWSIRPWESARPCRSRRHGCPRSHGPAQGRDRRPRVKFVIKWPRVCAVYRGLGTIWALETVGDLLRLITVPRPPTVIDLTDEVARLERRLGRARSRCDFPAAEVIARQLRAATRELEQAKLEATAPLENRTAPEPSHRSPVGRLSEPAAYRR
jgi:hypothetical protein